MPAKMSGEVPGSGNRRRRSNELSPREREVLELRAEGFSHKEVAYRLSMSVQTVKNHIFSANRRVGGRSIRELLADEALRILQERPQN